MQLREGADVLTAGGDKAGEVDRVVLDPVTKEITHLVVQKGFLFTEEKVVPMSLVGPATEDKVTLWEQAGDLEELPDYKESDYVAAEIEPGATQAAPTWARPLYAYPPFIMPGRMTARSSYAVPDYVVRQQKNIPEGTVALEAGAKVFGSAGQQIGDIERIFVDPEREEATHLLIAEGIFLKQKKLVPISWISSVNEEVVNLSVEADLVESLPEYEPES